MSSIRLSGTSSGYYDLTVPAAAGTNSIDLSNLVVKDSNGNLGIGTASPQTTLDTGYTRIYNSGAASSPASGKGLELHYVTSGRTQGEGAYLISYDRDNSGYKQFTVDANSINLSTVGVNRMIIDSSGYVRRPYQPCFDVASNQSVAQNSYQTFNVQYHNVGNHFSLANNRFTAPVSGLYQFFATTIKNTSDTSGVARVYIYVNGAASNGNRHVRLSAGSQYGTNGVGSWIISMSAGDYAQVYMGGGGNGSHSSFEYTYFNGYLLQ